MLRGVEIVVNSTLTCRMNALVPGSFCR